MVTLPTDAVRVPDRLAGLPTRTLPKASELELAVNRGVTPLPDKETVVGEVEAESEKLMLPLELPVAVGVKSTVNVALWPAAKVKGKVSPLRE